MPSLDILTKKIPLCRFKNSPTEASTISSIVFNSSSAYLDANFTKEFSSASIKSR